MHRLTLKWDWVLPFSYLVSHQFLHSTRFLSSNHWKPSFANIWGNRKECHDLNWKPLDIICFPGDWQMFLFPLNISNIPCAFVSSLWYTREYLGNPGPRPFTPAHLSLEDSGTGERWFGHDTILYFVNGRWLSSGKSICFWNVNSCNKIQNLARTVRNCVYISSKTSYVFLFLFLEVP